MKVFSLFLLPLLAVADGEAEQERRLDAIFGVTPPPISTNPPTGTPTLQPTRAPTPLPTRAPTRNPTLRPTLAPFTVSPTSSMEPSSIPPPLCGTQTDGIPPTDFNYSNIGTVNTGTGTFWSSSYSNGGGMYEFSVTQKCEYRMRSTYTNWTYAVMEDPDDYFKAVAIHLRGDLLTSTEVSYYTGYGVPRASVTNVTGCTTGFCVGVDGPGVAQGPIVYQFKDSMSQTWFKSLMDSVIGDNDASKIFGTNWYHTCGAPPFCWGRGFGQGTCYVEPLVKGGSQCGDVEYKIDYLPGQKPANSVADGTKDMFPWFNECCHTFKCTRDNAATNDNFKYVSNPSATVANKADGKFSFSFRSGTTAITWTCPTRDHANGLKDFADALIRQGLHTQNSTSLSCVEPNIPGIVSVPPVTPPPGLPPKGPTCQNVTSSGVCRQHPEGTCYIAPPTDCGPLSYVIETNNSSRLVYNDVAQWYDVCVQKSFGCVKRALTGNITYTGAPSFAVGFNSTTQNWTFTLTRDNSKIKGAGDIVYECSTSDKVQGIRNFTSTVAKHNGWGNTYSTDLFLMKPSNCTKAPTTAPSASPSRSISPSGTPTLAPTYCKESYLDSENLNIALVLDLSYSTYNTSFSGTFNIGDFNGDGKENTILDAEGKAVEALLDAIYSTGTLNNGNSEIALISFHTSAKFHSVYGPLNAAGNGRNEVLMNTIKNELRSVKTVSEIMETNNGYTNFDAALDVAVEYFNTTASKGRLNLLVFLSDGEPTVRGDGDSEGYCADTVNFWKAPGVVVNCSEANLQPGAPLSFCFGGDASCTNNNQYQDCVRGGTACHDSSAVAQYSSELQALDAMGVERLAIGVGPESNVASGSALWQIDDNPVKDKGVLPTQVMTTDGLSRALSNLCILNTGRPTPSPSLSPSEVPTKSPAPSQAPTGDPSAEPTSLPTVKMTPPPSPAPTSHPTPTLPSHTLSPTHELPDCYSGPKLIKKDSSNHEMCIYSPNMVGIKAMKTETVDIVIYDVWPVENPNTILVFNYTNGVDALFAGGDALQCANPDGNPLAPNGQTVLSLQCSRVSPGDPFLAVIDVLVIDPKICDSNSVPHPCGGDDVLESCSWRLVLPCEEEAICSESPSKSPTATPTASSEPSSSPIATLISSPTGAPVQFVPTGGPVQFVGTPSTEYGMDDDSTPDIFVPVGPPECPDDILQVAHVGKTKLPPGTVEIIDQGESYVKVGLHQKWSVTKIDFIYFQYQVDDYSNKCFAESEVVKEKFEEITIVCTHHTKIAMLDLFVTDDEALRAGDDAIVPKCCHPDVPDTAKTVSYVLEISCVSKCPGETSRKLRGLA